MIVNDATLPDGPARFEVFSTARRIAPTQTDGRDFHLFRRSDIIDLLRRPHEFKADDVISAAADGSLGMVRRDGRDHHQVRKPLVDYLHRALPLITSATQRSVSIMLRDVDLRAGFEVGALFSPVPVAVTEELLDTRLDLTQVRRWGRFAAQNLAALTDLEREDDPRVARTARAELHDFVTGALVSAQSGVVNPDSLTALLIKLVDGGQLAEDDAAGIYTTMVLAPGQAVIEAIYNCVFAVAVSPAVQTFSRERLAAGESLKPVVAEALRLYTPSQFVTRTAVGPVRLGRYQLEAGQKVHGWLASANRDEQHYTRPTEFDPLRAEPGHLFFGAGPHYCVAAPFVLEQVEVVLAALLKATRWLRFSPVRRWLPSAIAFRPLHLFVHDETTSH